MGLAVKSTELRPGRLLNTLHCPEQTSHSKEPLAQLSIVSRLRTLVLLLGEHSGLCYGAELSFTGDGR